nr:MAG TPA: zinc knuckle protein [Caudoviricetes sp.]
MNAQDKCNRCEQFGPNKLTPYPCKRIPSRNCPWFIKISEKKYKAILAARVKIIE